MDEYICLDCGEIFLYDPNTNNDLLCPKCKSDNVNLTLDEEDEI